jgi:hypothetical protein
MVRGRIHPKTKERFRKSIRDVIKGLSRKVLVYKQPLKHECPNCFYDKLTNKSTGKCKWTISEAQERQAAYVAQNPGTTNIRYKWFRNGRCPVCHGKGYLETKRKTWADCLVIWNPQNRYGNEMTYTPAGSEGSTIVQLKADPKYYDTFKNCVNIIVDGVECKLSRPPLLRGLGNQSVLIITAFTTEKPKIDSGEIIKDYT